MELGYTVWTWLSDEHRDWCRVEDPKAAFEQACREVSHLGYKTIENFNWFADFYEDNPQEVLDIMNRYGLKFVNIYHYLTPDFEADVENGKRYAKFGKAVGAKYMNLQMQTWKDKPYNRPLNKEKVEDYARKANIIGQIAKDQGLTVCVHPHANTPVFTMDQIDYFLENTDPKLVSLCIDTAHIALSGGDPVEAFNKYIDRIAYVHLKDIDPDVTLNPEWPMKRFRALGQGNIDFKGVFNVLKEHNFDGVVCVELDYQKVCHYESAQYSRNYLKDVIGI